MCSIHRGEFNISGLKNKTLHLHGLLRKSGGIYKYVVTLFGKQAINAGPKLRERGIIRNEPVATLPDPLFCLIRVDSNVGVLRVK